MCGFAFVDIRVCGLAFEIQICGGPDRGGDLESHETNSGCACLSRVFLLRLGGRGYYSLSLGSCILASRGGVGCPNESSGRRCYTVEILVVIALV
jgi:hypothetical protein